MRGMWTSVIKQEVWRTLGDAKKSTADEKASTVNPIACMRSVIVARKSSSSSMTEIRVLLDKSRISRPAPISRAALRGDPIIVPRTASSKNDVTTRVWIGDYIMGGRCQCFGTIDGILRNNGCHTFG